MLPAVESDHQLAVDAEEIDGVAEQRHLPPELQTVVAAIADEGPQDVLGFRRSDTELSGEKALFRGYRKDGVSACPSRQGRSLAMPLIRERGSRHDSYTSLERKTWARPPQGEIACTAQARASSGIVPSAAIGRLSRSLSRSCSRASGGRLAQ